MRTITDLFRLARGDFHGEPAQLMHKRPILDRRLDHAEEAAGRRGGIGINSAVELRKILREIEDEARSQLEVGTIDQQEFDRVCARAQAICQKLSRSEDNRAQRLKARNEDRARLLASAKAPFDLKDLISREEVQKLLAESKSVDLNQLRSMRDLGFLWKKAIKDGKVQYFLVTPTAKFGVWTRRQYEDLRRRAGRRNNPTHSANQEVTTG